MPNHRPGRGKAANRNALMDTLRLAASFFVVVLHAPLPGAFSEAIRPILRCAVPFFFMVSGYWLADSDTQRMRARMDKQAKKMALLLAACCAAFFAMHVGYSVFIERAGFLAPLHALLDLRALGSFFLFNNTNLFWPGGSAHLWFLAALLYVLFLLRFLLKKIPLRRIYILIPVLLAIAVPLAMFSSRTVEGVQERDMVTRNFLFTGLPCVLAGMWLRQHEDRLKRLPDWAVLLLPLVFAGLCVLERNSILRNAFGLSRILFAASLVLLSMRFPAFTAKTPLPRWGERYSLMVYIAHYPIVSALKWLVSRGLPELALRWGGAAIAFALALGFAVLWYHIKDKFLRRTKEHA